jgi:glycosyltransferase involved in cell wall biosynthesis
VAHIFKHPSNETKGIVVFTHKEMDWFFPDNKKLMKKFIKPGGLRRKEIIKNFLQKPYSKAYQKIRKKYFIGVHYGWDPEQSTVYGNCDFILAGHEVKKGIEKNIFRIPLVSRNFTPNSFFNNHAKKYWDIICVSRMIKFKNLDILLKNIKKIYDLGYKYKVLLIAPENKLMDKNKFYTSLMDDYYKLFSYEEQQRFTIIPLSPKIGFPGLSQEAIAMFYNNSKVFTLFSQAEGGPKVVSEALLCGLPVVVKNDLGGVGRDFLTEENSKFFSSFDKAYEALIDAVENYDKFKINTNELRQVFGEEASLKKLREYFKTLYENNNQVFDGNLINTDNLNIRLNGHMNKGLEWTRDRFSTADIVTLNQLKIFMNYLKLK